MRTVSYGIKDIASWLLDENGEIQLPAIQRGFVWRTYQIENLWDSIFREYPVGSFLLSENKGVKELFDGQQRATSIALGFYNPWEKHEGKVQIGNDKSLPTIWVDLSPSVEQRADGTKVKVMSANSAYLFRVLTKSHPWGYRAWNNGEKIYLNDRKNAWEQMKSYGVIKYTKLSPSQRLPYSARVPVPLCFLLESYKETKDKYDVYHLIVNHYDDTCHSNVYIESVYDSWKRVISDSKVSIVKVDEIKDKIVEIITNSIESQNDEVSHIGFGEITW